MQDTRLPATQPAPRLVPSGLPCTLRCTLSPQRVLTLIGVMCCVVQHCWVLYNEYLKCGKKLGIKNDKCYQVWKWANSICPTDLMVSWYEARRDDKW